MTGAPKRYVFQTPSQWGAGLVTGGMIGAGGLTAAARLSGAPLSIWQGDAYAPAIMRSGEVYWRDAAGALHWLTDGDPPEICDSGHDPGVLGTAQRLIGTTGRLWAQGAGAVGVFDRRTLQQVAEVAVPGTIRDIAWAERQAIAALVESAGKLGLVRIDKRERTADIATPELDDQAFLVARAASRWVIAEPARLRWAPPGDPAAGWADLPLTALGQGAGLTVALLAAFSPTWVLLVCSAGPGTPNRLVVLGQGGEVLDDQVVPAAVGALHGIAGAGSSVWLASAAGLWRWNLRSDAGLGNASFVTPMLRSPLGQDSGWLRAEVQADLPPGATIACEIGSTANPETARTAQGIISDPTKTAAAKAAALDALLHWGPPVQVGAGRDAPGLGAVSAVQTPWVLPLQAVTDEFLWLRLHIAGGDPSPKVSSLTVLYPELSLMRRLPAIYRAAPSAHLRGLVALLDIMVQGLDRRIAGLGKLVDPASTPHEWLDYLASWLGLPWEAGLPVDIRRAMLIAAPDLLAERGTPAGIRRLVGAVLPGRAVRLSDAANLAPAMLAYPGQGGARLPTVLLGRKQDATRLNVAVLGRSRLRPCGPDDDPLLRLSGWVMIDVSATSAERAALSGPLSRLLAGYVPAGLTPVLRWHLWPSGAGRRLDEDLSLQGDRPGLLGQDIRLGGITLSGSGPSLRRGLELSDYERLL